MRSSIRLFSIAGIDVGIHPTWFIAFALIAWTFATGLLPRQSPGWSETQYWVAGAASSALLFVSVLAHELAHSFTARWLGFPVYGITLFLFGGVSRISGRIQRARSEFMIAFAGPASSLLIGGVCVLAARELVPERGPVPLGIGIVSILGYLNLFLGAFNLLPGHPLDGGRVLRSVIWGLTGNQGLASTAATMSGRALAIGLGAFGAFRLFQGDALGGVWMIILAMFLLGSASQESGHSERAPGSGVTVGSALIPTPGVAEADMTLEYVARRYFLVGRQEVVPVVRNGELIGFIEPRDASQFSDADWPNLIVGSLVEHRGFAVADLHDSAAVVVRRLSSGGSKVAAVFNGTIFLGAATLESLNAAIAQSSA